MVDILRTATSGLMAFRAALATTGHNIANVNTAYYSRQRVELSAPMPEGQGYGYLGRGVDIDSVARIYNGFVMQQLRGHQSGVSQYDTMNTLTGQMSALLGDTDVGLTPDLEAFFGSLQDLANSPTSITARQVFLDEGQTLTNRVQDIDAALSSLRESVDVGIRNAVTAINDLSTGLAKINQDISLASQSLTNAPNDLLDQRDKILVDLAELVGIQVVAQDGDRVSVFMSNGQPLVVGNNALKLEAVQSGFDPQEITVRLEGQAEGSDLEASITTGQLGGYFEFRRTILNPAQDALGLLAIGVAETFNEQHRQGMDLNGDLGSDLFTVGAPKVLTHQVNKGSAVFSAALNDTTGPYELSYSAATTSYSLKRLSDGAVVASNFTLTNPLTVDGITIELSSGATVNDGDRFLLQPTSRGVSSSAYNGNGGTTDVIFKATALPATDSSKLLRSDYEIRASGVASQATLTNSGNATISTPVVRDPEAANLTNTVRILFTGPATYNVVDATTGASLAVGQAYTSGATIPAAGNYNGWTVQISDGAAPIAAGDSFEISAGYVVTRLSDSQEILSGGGLTALNTVLRDEGLNVSLTGSPPQDGDRFLLQPTRRGSALFEMVTSDPRKVAVAAPITTSATATNLGSGSISAGVVTDSKRVTLQNKVEIRFTSDNTFNVFDLDTNTLLDKGVSFPPIVAKANSSNSGTAAITAPVVADYTDPKLRNTLEVRFTSATQYEVVDVTTGTTLTPAGGVAYVSGTTIPAAGDYNGLTFQISGTLKAGDKFEINSSTANPISYNGWEVNITGAPRGRIVASAAAGNLGTATVTAPTITDYRDDALTDTVEIRFTSATLYDVVNIKTGVTLAAGQTYTSGNTIPPAGDYNGWTVKIADGVSPPQAGDKFTIKNDGDTFQIKSNQGGIGDNRNALGLVKLQTKQQLLGGNDYRGVYAQMIAEVGAQGRRVENTLQSQEALLSQSELSRESVSGVSLDEEAADLLRFQQSYQAAAQVIQTANSLFDSLLDAVGS
jgi:flagellar hook-associated protein 1 FlgK